MVQLGHLWSCYGLILVIYSLYMVFFGLTMSLYPFLVTCGTELTPPQGVGKALQQVWSVKECGKVIEIPNIQVHNSPQQSSWSLRRSLIQMGTHAEALRTC